MAIVASMTVAELLARSGWVRRLARSIVHDAAAADDLVQEACMSALRDSPAQDRALIPWVSTVLRNRARKQRLADLRRGARERAAGERPTVVSPEELASRVEMQRTLVTLVMELAEPSREVVLLRYFEGLTPAEIGVALGVPAGTVRWRLKLARDEIRRRLEREHGPEWKRLLAPLAIGRAARWPLASGGALVVVAAAILAGRVGTVGDKEFATRPAPPSLELASTAGASRQAPIMLPIVTPSRELPRGTSGPHAAASSPARWYRSRGQANRRLAAAPTAACETEVRRLRNDLAGAEQELLWVIPPDRLFERGHPSLTVARKSADGHWCVIR
jgi:RNA polymerase sigma-70 factor (ECF subfamily)